VRSVRRPRPIPGCLTSGHGLRFIASLAHRAFGPPADRFPEHARQLLDRVKFVKQLESMLPILRQHTLTQASHCSLSQIEPLRSMGPDPSSILLYSLGALQRGASLTGSTAPRRSPGTPCYSRPRSSPAPSADLSCEGLTMKKLLTLAIAESITGDPCLCYGFDGIALGLPILCARRIVGRERSRRPKR
jgi:hypothetical protein